MRKYKAVIQWRDNDEKESIKRYHHVEIMARSVRDALEVVDSHMFRLPHAILVRLETDGVIHT